jgi:O-succinylbenzoic acid--CoA ligase
MMEKYIINSIEYSRDELLSYINRCISDFDDWEREVFCFIGQWLSDDDVISLQTSGSTGMPQTVSFPRQAFINSALATINYFQINPFQTLLLCLPARYVAARLMIVRAFVAGCNLLMLPPSSDVISKLSQTVDFAALVPLQVSQALLISPEKLNLIEKLIIGGSSVSETLKFQLANVSVKCWETYGMTETLTHVAVRCINGIDKQDAFEALPDIIFEVNANGCLVIHVPRISSLPVVTNDVVELINERHFKLLGRLDCVINSGGIKVHAEMVENKLKQYLPDPFAVFGIPDERLGQMVAIAFEANEGTINYNDIFRLAQLTRFELPRRIFFCKTLPTTESGKIKRSELLKLLIDKQ